MTASDSTSNANPQGAARALASRLKSNLLDRFVPYGLRLTPAYRRWRAFLDDSQTWSAERHAEYQLEKLKALLTHAESHVPYYRRIFAEYGVRAADCNDLGYIRKLPTLTKQMVRDHFDELCSEVIPDDSEAPIFTTGGSTGEPMAMRRELGFWEIERAFIHRSWSWIGYRPGDRLLQIRGNVVDADRLKAGKIWQIDWRQRTMRLSAFSLEPGSLEKALQAIQLFKPKFLHAYPTSAMAFARLLNSENKEFPASLEGVLLASEPIFPQQREYLAESFGCRIFSHYGLAEAVGYAAECECGTDYHIIPEYALIERLDANSEAVTAAGASAEIVGTGFHALAFPLIRYRTSDFVELPEDTDTCSCGRAYTKLGSVLGRGQDVLVGADGRHIPLTSFTFGRHMAAWQRIRMMQLEQQEPGRAIFRVVRADDYCAADEDEIAKDFATNAGGQLVVTFEYVDDIPRTQSGKLRHLIQHLAIDGPYAGDPESLSNLQ